MPRYEGRLELTWTNKHERLLAHDDGSYEWLPASDYRVAEVRLLQDAGTVGKVGKHRAADNLLIRGDALHALTSLTKLPEFAREYVGKVKLAYIDPPFNTGQAFAHYDDALEHSVWLTMMRDRLQQISLLLAENGSVWLHLDESEIHRARLIMDEVFGTRAFVTTIVWQKRTTRENRPAFSPTQDYLLVYAPSGPTVWKAHRNKLVRGSGGFSNPDGDPKGKWASIPFTAKGKRKNQVYTITTPTGVVYTPPFKNRCWGATQPEYERLLAEGRIYFPNGGNGKPRVKQYEFEDEGLVPDTWWSADTCGTNDDAKKHLHVMFPVNEEFSTPKPEELLQRVIHIGSNEGDIVLDCFAGSGTTAAVAHKMSRKWVTVEREPATISTYTKPRLSKVVVGDDEGGITDTMGWEGGGGFRVLEVAPSMFEAIDGIVFLGDWMTNGKLAEATAAQLGFQYENEPPFSGRKGRTRLAVVDGVVNEAVVRLLVSALAENERVVVCGTGLDPEARGVLRDLRPGSTLRKVPAALLDRYRTAGRREHQSVSDRQVAAVSELPDTDTAASAPARAKTSTR